MEISLDRESPVPLAQQIAAGLRQQISTGLLAAGSRLPSSRQLASVLGVNRATVLNGFHTLQEEGLVESGVGRGTFVTGHRSDADTAEPEEAPPRHRGLGFSWSALLGAEPRDESDARSGGNGNEPPYTLSRAVPSRELFPEKEICDSMVRAFRLMRSEILDYSSPAGFEPLRETLRKRLTARGIDMRRNDVLIVNGSQQGLDLVARLIPPGRPVITSSPSFSGALAVLGRVHQMVGAPIDAGGIDPDAVDHVARRRGASLIYTIPFCHNPTGVTLTCERSALLLEAARRHRVPVLEDDWLGELRCSGDPPPLKARDDHDQVLYLGTISKVLVPGLRIGWLVAPRQAFDALVALKRDTDLASNLPGQAALAQLFDSGFIDRHVQDLGVALERRRHIVLDAIERYFPAEARPLDPGRGMVLWIQLPQGVDDRSLVQAAQRAGVEIAPGASFFPGAADRPGFRISYARAAMRDLAPAIRLLGRALEGVLAAASHPTAAAPPLV